MPQLGQVSSALEQFVRQQQQQQVNVLRMAAPTLGVLVNEAQSVRHIVVPHVDYAASNPLTNFRLHPHQYLLHGLVRSW